MKYVYIYKGLRLLSDLVFGVVENVMNSNSAGQIYSNYLQKTIHKKITKITNENYAYKKNNNDNNDILVTIKVIMVRVKLSTRNK